jgi:hypothetical protein
MSFAEVHVHPKLLTHQVSDGNMITIFDLLPQSLSQLPFIHPGVVNVLLFFQPRVGFFINPA